MMTYSECAVRALNELGFDASLSNGKVFLSVWNMDLSDSFEFMLSEAEVLEHGKKYAERFEREVTEKEWDEIPLVTRGSATNTDEHECVSFETYGDDAEIIAKYAKLNQVVTLCDDNDGKGEYIYFGFRRVNRLLHYITEQSLETCGLGVFDCDTIHDMTGMTTKYFKQM